MPLRILVQRPRDSLSGDFSAAKASAWPGRGAGGGVVALGSGNGLLSFVWTVATRRDRASWTVYL